MYKIFKHYFKDYDKKEYVIISYNGPNKDIEIHSFVLKYKDAINFLNNIQNKQNKFVTYNGLGYKKYYIVNFTDPITP